MRMFRCVLMSCLLSLLGVQAIARQSVVDIPTRPGVSERALYVEPDTGAPRAAAVLLPGGHGSLKLFPNGSIGWGDLGFLVRTREQFAAQGIAVLVLDAPSDKRAGLGGFRDTAEHATDIGAAIAWLRQRAGVPVWLVGHSRGTESATSATLRLGAPPAGPDGLVLASSILADSSFVSGKALTHYAIEQVKVPVLVLHHEADPCSVTPPGELPSLVDKLPKDVRTKVVRLPGGRQVGEACGHDGLHGFGGLDASAVKTIADFMVEAP